MADNVTVDNGGLTDYVVASDEEVGVGQHQYVKNEFGSDGVFTKVTSTVGLPVNPVQETAGIGVGAAADASAAAGGVGSLSAKLRLVTAQLDAIQTAVQILDNAIAGAEMQVDIVSAPATTRTTDSISAALATDRLMNNLTAVTPSFAIIDAAISGDNTLLAAQGVGNKIRVHSLYLIASAAVTVRFESGAAGTALSGQMVLAANGGFVLPFNPAGWFETAANTLLNLELSGAISVDGGFQYTVVT